MFGRVCVVLICSAGTRCTVNKLFVVQKRVGTGFAADNDLHCLSEGRMSVLRNICASSEVY